MAARGTRRDSSPTTRLAPSRAINIRHQSTPSVSRIVPARRIAEQRHPQRHGFGIFQIGENWVAGPEQRDGRGARRPTWITNPHSSEYLRACHPNGTMATPHPCESVTSVESVFDFCRVRFNAKSSGNGTQMTRMERIDRDQRVHTWHIVRPLTDECGV